MRFRPCIDIHNGKVKQIVGGSLTDYMDQATENFVSEADSTFYAKLYQEKGLSGGHVILLNGSSSSYYEDTKEQAFKAVAAYPGGLQIGGGITPENAAEFLHAGASHVVVTSYVFREGKIDQERLEKMRDAVGKEHLVLDVSCRRKGDKYYVVTDRWQTFTDTVVNHQLLDKLYEYCDEFLIHGVDVEGSAKGIEEQLAAMLGDWGKCPITYAGGIGSFEDLQRLKELGQGKLDFTVGSALDIFGGNLDFNKVCQWK